jgi:RNA-splicing ligase RtcB
VIKKCIGKIGNGNHFIEICRNSQDQHIIVVHSGSKFLGQKISNYHQSKFIDNQSRVQFSSDSLEYIYDMIFAQFFSQMNREYLIQKILFVLNDKNPFDENKLINSTHNYIDFEDLIVRKGAIRAKLNEKCIVALNMKEGVLICSGKSNEEWNFSCAHGCGRLTSRNVHNKNDELKKLKNLVYLNHQYHEDLPSKYKPCELIKELIEPTVFVLDQYKTVYNFKE